MNTAQKNTIALKQALADAPAIQSGSPETSPHAIANPLPRSETQNNQDRLAAAMASTAAAGTTEVTNSNLESSKDPVQGFDPPELKQQTEEEAKKEQKINEHIARLSAKEKNQQIIFDKAEKEAKAKVEQLKKHFLKISSKPKTRAKMKNVVADAALIDQVTVSLDGAKGTLYYWQAAILEATRINFMGDATESPIWDTATRRKKKQMKKGARGFGERMSGAKTGAEQTAVVHKEMSNMDTAMGE
jgi:hypothetical protein